MNKKIIAVMIVATLVFVGVFAACNNNKDENEPDRIYLEGDEYPFLTDDDGNKLLNEDGEFIVYDTDFNGDYLRNEYGDRVTKAQLFQPYSEGNKIEEYGYRITLPEDWSINESKAGAFINKETGDSVSVSVYDKSYQDAYESNFNTYESLLSYEELDVTWEENVTDLGEECEGVVRFTMKSEAGMNVLYLFRNHGNIYKILFESTNPDTAVAESVAICKAISYKPYDYYEPVTDEEGKEVEDVFLTQPVTDNAQATNANTTAVAE